MRRKLALFLLFFALSTSLATSGAEGATKKGGSTPEAAAKAFYRAWRYHDRAAALRVASAAPVKALFRTRASGPRWTFKGCVEADEPDPHFDCTYKYAGGRAVMAVGDSDAFGWFVTGLAFIPD